MIKFWTERTLHPLLLRILIMDIYAAIHENDRAYFRESREKRFGVTLEQLGADPQKYCEQLQAALEPLRLYLERTTIHRRRSARLRRLHRVRRAAMGTPRLAHEAADGR